MSAKTPVLRGKSNLGITVDSLEDGKNLVSAHHHLWQWYFLIEPNAAEGDSKKKNNHHLATLSTVNSIERNSTEDRYAEAMPCLSQQSYRRPRSFSPSLLLLYTNTENPATVQ